MHRRLEGALVELIRFVLFACRLETRVARLLLARHARHHLFRAVEERSAPRLLLLSLLRRREPRLEGALTLQFLVRLAFCLLLQRGVACVLVERLDRRRLAEEPRDLINLRRIIVLRVSA